MKSKNHESFLASGLILNTNYYFAVIICRDVNPKKSVMLHMINSCTLLLPLYMKPSIIKITEKCRSFIKNSLNLLGLEGQNYMIFW